MIITIISININKYHWETVYSNIIHDTLDLIYNLISLFLYEKEEATDVFLLWRAKQYKN